MLYQAPLFGAPRGINLDLNLAAKLYARSIDVDVARSYATLSRKLRPIFPSLKR